MKQIKSEIYSKEKILSRDKAFVDLTKPDILKRINIDEKLIPTFIKVMNKFQEFFDRKGLMKANNFALFFEKHLIGDDKDKFSIKISDIAKEAKVRDAVGLYIKDERKILVEETSFNEDIEVYPEVVESILAHEFIHFLTFTDLPWIENKNGDFVQQEKYFIDYSILGGFVNEGFTQLIAEQMYPLCVAYYPYTSMMKMYLSAFDSEDYFNFFRLRLPGKTYESEKVERFMNSGERLFQLLSGKNVSTEEEIQHPYYQEAFNLLVDVFEEKISLEIERFEFASVEEFVERVYNFKESVIFKSNYLSEKINHIITDFVSYYFATLPISSQYEVKKGILKLIEKDIRYILEPNLTDVYHIPSEEDGYYCQVKNYGEFLKLESYSPEDILLRLDFIGKNEGAEGWFDFYGALVKKNKSVDFYIKNDKFFISLYDESLNKLSDEAIEKLPENKLPKLYTLPLDNEKGKAKVFEKGKSAFQKLEKLNSLISEEQLILMDIMNSNQDIYSVIKVEDIFKKRSKQGLYFSIDKEKEIKFFYINGRNYKEINKLSSNLIKLPISEDENMFVSVKVENGYIKVISFDESGKNHKDLKASYLYHVSSSYLDKERDKDLYEQATEQIDDLEM